MQYFAMNFENSKRNRLSARHFAPKLTSPYSIDMRSIDLRTELKSVAEG